jgi:hypothetical protein
MAWGTSQSTLDGSAIPSLTKTELIHDIRFVRRMGGGEAPVQEFPEGDTAAFEAGQAVYLTQDGNIEEADDGADGILGIANKTATGTENTAIPVTLALPDVVFMISFDTPASVATTVVGDIVDHLVNASGVHVADEDATTDLVYRVVGLPPGATDSTHVNYGKVYVTVNASQLGQDSQLALA